MGGRVYFLLEKLMFSTVGFFFFSTGDEHCPVPARQALHPGLQTQPSLFFPFPLSCVTLNYPGWPWAHSVAQAGLGLTCFPPACSVAGMTGGSYRPCNMNRLLLQTFYQTVVS